MSQHIYAPATWYKNYYNVMLIICCMASHGKYKREKMLILCNHSLCEQINIHLWVNCGMTIATYKYKYSWLSYPVDVGKQH